MPAGDRIYAAIDLKSFYASVECRERGMDPLDTNLVVADESRTEKTICLAVSPALKSLGIPGRARLFEVVQAVKKVNRGRRSSAPGNAFAGSSVSAAELRANPSLELAYVAARPRMKLYMEYSTRIYRIYLRYASAEDIHVYSVDEVLIDLTDYLEARKMTPREMVRSMIRDVLAETGITATAGIGTNLFLAKVAMDITAKHIPADADGVRIAELDEMSYRRQLWSHRPITDFWRVGKGYARKLEAEGLLTMGDVARCSAGKDTDYYNEDLLYRLFGVNAELLIDHAWGYEPCTIRDIKAYRPESHSISAGQVLQQAYDFSGGRLIVREMADALTLELVEKRLVTDQMVLTVGYDRENLDDPERRRKYKGPVTTDFYGRKVPKSAHGSINLPEYMSSTREITEAVMRLYDRIVNPDLLVRRFYVVANHVIPETEIPQKETYEQLDLFTDYAKRDREQKEREERLARERKMQEAVLSIQKKFGKNAVLKGMNLEKEATGRERNEQVGGHKA